MKNNLLFIYSLNNDSKKYSKKIISIGEIDFKSVDFTDIDAIKKLFKKGQTEVLSLQRTVKKQRREIKTLRMQVYRYKAKVKSIKSLMFHMKGRKLISEEVSLKLEVSINEN